MGFLDPPTATTAIEAHTQTTLLLVGWLSVHALEFALCSAHRGQILSGFGHHIGCDATVRFLHSNRLLKLRYCYFIHFFRFSFYILLKKKRNKKIFDQFIFSSNPNKSYVYVCVCVPFFRISSANKRANRSFILIRRLDFGFEIKNYTFLGFGYEWMFIYIILKLIHVTKKIAKLKIFFYFCKFWDSNFRREMLLSYLIIKIKTKIRSEDFRHSKYERMMIIFSFICFVTNFLESKFLIRCSILLE